MFWIDWVVLLFAVILITMVALQTSKDDAASAFSGEKSELFANKKERGVEVLFTRATLFVAVSFMVLVSIATFVFDSVVRLFN